MRVHIAAICVSLMVLPGASAQGVPDAPSGAPADIRVPEKRVPEKRVPEKPPNPAPRKPAAAAKPSPSANAPKRKAAGQAAPLHPTGPATPSRTPGQTSSSPQNPAGGAASTGPAHSAQPQTSGGPNAPGPGAPGLAPQPAPPQSQPPQTANAAPQSQPDHVLAGSWKVYWIDQNKTTELKIAQVYPGQDITNFVGAMATLAGEACPVIGSVIDNLSGQFSDGLERKAHIVSAFVVFRAECKASQVWIEALGLPAGQVLMSGRATSIPSDKSPRTYAAVALGR